MFLTALNYARRGGQDVMWRRHMYRKLAWGYLGRKRTCFKLQIRTVDRALRYSSTTGQSRQDYLKHIVNTRVAAACWEHGVIYKEFLNTLDESSVALNRNMLQQLAMYEPRTFQSLCDFTVKRRAEIGLQSARTVTPSGVLTRSMLK